MSSVSTSRGVRALVLRLFLLAALFGLLAAGCAQQETASNSGGTEGGAASAPGNGSGAAAGETTVGTPPPAPEGALKVGLITPGKISDKGWNASAYTGVQKIKTELGAEVSPPVEEPGLAQVEGVFRDLAQQGHHLIFAHGSEYDDAAKKVAPEFPKTTFVVMGGRSSAANLTPIQFESGQATYLAGMLAASMSKTGKLGLIGPTKIPIIEQSFAAFEKGAKTVKPTVEVKTTFVGSEDIPKAKQQAQALLESGVDVIMHNANAGGQGVAQAVTEKPGAMFIGANADQRDLATPKNLGSFILDVPSAMLGVARAVKDGKGEGKAFGAGVKDKAVGFVFNPGFVGTIPAEARTRLTQAERDLAAGKINPKAAGGSAQ